MAIFVYQKSIHILHVTTTFWRHGEGQVRTLRGKSKFSLTRNDYSADMIPSSKIA